MAKTLFASGVRINSEKDFELLMDAIQSNSILLVQCFEVIFINLFSIHLGGSTEMIQLLIDNDINLNSKDYFGDSLIYKAICSRNSHKLYHKYVLYTAHK